eukprot:scaffold24415_cov46-Phaeocystis_antarctica.AAC.4
MIPLRRPSRRSLSQNDLSGSLPSQLGRLTALRVGGGRARRVAACREKRARHTCRPLHLPPFPHDPASAPLSQVPVRQRPERQPALAARAAQPNQWVSRACIDVLLRMG